MRALYILALLLITACAAEPNAAGEKHSLIGKQKIIPSGEVTVGSDYPVSDYPHSHYSLGTDGKYHYNPVYNKD